jgi:RNA polymerase sigma-70 factor (ECF subfamily)
VGQARPSIDPELLLAQSSWVRALARRLVAGGEDAEDLVQETWRVALERPPRVSGSIPVLRSWLATVLRNLARTRRSREDLRAFHEARAARHEAQVDEEATEERVLLQRRLADCVLALEEPYRSAIVLRYFDGLTPRQVAERQGISYDAARQRLSRGIAKIRARLDREHPGGRASWSVMCAAILRRPATVAGAPLLTVGGMVMGVKSVVIAAAALVLAAACLLWWSQLTDHARGTSDLAGDGSVALALDAGADGEPALPESPRDEHVSIAAPSVSRSLGELERELTGLVLDPEGEPVRGARVEVLRNGFSEHKILDPDYRPSCVSIAEAETDDQGEFAIALPLGRAFDVAVEAAGFARAQREHCHAGERVEVRLEAGAAIYGRVMRAEDQEPMPVVRVELRRSNTNDLPESTPRLATTTDDSGRYRFRDISSGKYHLAVVRASRATTVEVAPGARVQCHLTVEGGRTVSGRVLDALSRGPIAGAEVDWNRRFEHPVRTDAYGRYTLTGFPLDPQHDEHGRYTLTGFPLDPQHAVQARAPGYARTEVPLQGRGDGADIEGVEVLLPRGSLIRGRVLDSDGAPVAEAYVAAGAYGRDKTIRLDWCATRTLENGSFELAGARRDYAHVLWIKREGFATLAYAFPKREAELTVINFGDIRLPPAATVLGELVDETGRPYARHPLRLRGWNDDFAALGTDLDVRLERPSYERVPLQSSQISVLENFMGERRTCSDDRGRFSFGDLAAGTYLLVTRMAGSFSESTLGLTVAEGSTVREVRLVLPRGFAIEGRVVSTSGEPIVAFVSCQVLRRGENPPIEGNDGSAMTDASGHFRIEGLSPAVYGVSAVPRIKGESTDRPTWLQVRLHTPGGTRDLEIVVPRGAPLSGTVLTASGEPASEVSVLAERNGEHVKRTSTNADGSFEFWIPEGAGYELIARPTFPDPSNPSQRRWTLDEAKAARAPGVSTGGKPVILVLP